MKRQAIVGREEEIKILKECYASGKPELVAVYGRIRVGKTFLIRQLFEDKFDFYMTGIYEGSKEEQLSIFNKQLNAYSKQPFPKVTNWFDAFDQLKALLISTTKKRLLVFIDELPWLDTPKSRFIKALELFWNSWGSVQPNLMIIFCGSATTWMINKLLSDKGGLHNRITRRIKLSPFTLKETELYINNLGIEWDRFQIAECYMAMGGTPYYLSMLRKGMSLSQNIDYLFFSKDAALKAEYGFLFRSLFKDSSIYKTVVETLGKKSSGMTRAEIQSSLKLSDGGRLSYVLNELQNCDFIRRYSGFNKKERDAVYRLCDMYTLFYNRFLTGKDNFDEHTWTNMEDNQTRRIWRGYAFEQICLLNIPQIKKKLGISGVLTNVSSWTCHSDLGNGQIDLVIDRRDGIINLCEMKFFAGPFVITKDYYMKLLSRKELFRASTKTRKALHLTMVTTFGLQKGAYNHNIQSEVTLNDLFE